MTSLKVCIKNFWHGAFEGDFFHYLLVLASRSNVEYVRDPLGADLVLSSVLGQEATDPNKTIQIIGENVRPNYTKARYSLSFDEDTWGGRNIQLPLWYARLRWPGMDNVKPQINSKFNHGYEDLIDPFALVSSRSLEGNDFSNKKFCAIVAGNPEPLRVNLFFMLKNIGKVDGYGSIFGNPLKVSKFDILHTYKFSLCPENSIYPGYVTEKLFDAWAGGTIPIYSGDLGRCSQINRGAFINYQDYQNSSDLLRIVSNLNDDPSIYETIYSQPLLLSAPDLSPIVRFLSSAIQNIITENRKD